MLSQRDARSCRLQAPSRIEADETGHVTALWTKPQIIGRYGRDGRPKPKDADVPEFRIPCDAVVVAIGQRIDSTPFEAAGLSTERGMITAGANTFRTKQYQYVCRW